jgi:tRNA 2-thiouridine synthesizing protein D
MKYAIIIHGAPYSSESCLSALRFTQATLEAGHEVLRVFFYHDAVQTASVLIAPPQDEIDITAEWQSVAQSHDLELIACIASCLRRGILDETEAERYEKPAANIADGFTIAGLGQMIDACMNADRVMTFGA